ncbi:hypothetical protein [Rhodococcus sp. IEGM 1379]|uniref:hypothetical protein n=1 Tax=Rhodococcus sp. IEGM 1379 TaxID=3047086 RepID=UPI0024B77FB8|nr:hypothetical protein [Rhodococcus sp. IEGM 1379]MDI9919091.1 hypothetical protein [Rhodococcus sp. IEGM 1379]
MAHDNFADQVFTRTAADRTGKLDTTAIAAAVLQNVTPFDTTALRDVVLQSTSAFDTVGLPKWEHPAMGAFQRIAEQVTTPAFEQIRRQIQANHRRRRGDTRCAINALASA